jgi:hypothetical protein
MYEKLAKFKNIILNVYIQVFDNNSQKIRASKISYDVPLFTVYYIIFEALRNQQDVNQNRKKMLLTPFISEVGLRYPFVVSILIYFFCK